MLQHDEARALILVSERQEKEGTDGRFFRFRPLATNEKLSRFQISFPRIFNSSPLNGVLPGNEISLWSISTEVEDYFLKRAGLNPGKIVFVDGNIPAIIDAYYAVGGESLFHRGLYYLNLYVTIDGDGTSRPHVSFNDFSFVRTLPLNTNPLDEADRALEQVAPRRH